MITNLIRELVVFMRHNIQFASKHVPGTTNVFADAPSPSRTVPASVHCCPLPAHAYCPVAALSLSTASSCLLPSGCTLSVHCQLMPTAQWLHSLCPLPAHAYCPVAALSLSTASSRLLPSGCALSVHCQLTPTAQWLHSLCPLPAHAYCPVAALSVHCQLTPTAQWLHSLCPLPAHAYCPVAALSLSTASSCLLPCGCAPSVHCQLTPTAQWLHSLCPLPGGAKVEALCSLSGIYLQSPFTAKFLAVWLVILGLSPSTQYKSTQLPHRGSYSRLSSGIFRRTDPTDGPLEIFRFQKNIFVSPLVANPIIGGTCLDNLLLTPLLHQRTL